MHRPIAGRLLFLTLVVLGPGTLTTFADPNDGRIDVKLLADGTVMYELDVMYGAYNVYRGEIETMISARIYTQNIPGVPGAARWCDGTSGALTDAFIPPLGRIAFYVATGTRPDIAAGPYPIWGNGESMPGHDSAQWERPHHFPCHPCRSNSDCTTGFCSKALDSCSFWPQTYGVCTPKPTTCSPVWEPVCGCNRVTYGNACEAAAAGWNIRRIGDCHLECQADAECAESEYCARDPGMCSGTGLCKERAEVCTADIDWACGCNARTYTNSCEAAAQGVNVAYDGFCACSTSAECHPAQYCAKPSQSCAAAGGCFERPTSCPAAGAIVCGCDGWTYQNACRANMAGTTVLHEGGCACTTNADCASPQFCLKQDLDCDGTGTCADRPATCPMLEQNTCGCDGNMYMNACTAHRTGVNVGPATYCIQ